MEPGDLFYLKAGWMTGIVREASREANPYQS
jgi:hypothetical protein